jgi:putative hydrolase of the HAD superfamily
MPCQAVLFDLFGTLIEVFSRREYDAVLDAMAARLEVPAERFRVTWHRTGYPRAVGLLPRGVDSLRQVLAELGLARDEAALESAVALRHDLCRRAMVPRPGVLETLAELRRRGLRVGLVSNCAPEVAEVWAQTPLAGAFDAVVLSCTAGCRKPDPLIYRLALRQLGVAPAAALFVGDGDDRELLGAQAVGLTAVQIRAAHEDAADALRLHDQPWPRRIATIPEVLGLLA